MDMTSNNTSGIHEEKTSQGNQVIVQYGRLAEKPSDVERPLYHWFDSHPESRPRKTLKQPLGGKHDELVELRKIKFDNRASQGAPASQIAPSSQLPPNPNIINLEKPQALATIDNQPVRMWPPGRLLAKMGIPFEL